MTITVSSKPKPSVFSAFHTSAHTKNVYSSLYYKRNHRVMEADTKTKLKIAAGSVLATILPMIYFAKKDPNLGLKKVTDLFKINYGFKEVFAVGAASIFGGVAAGIFADKKSDKKRKINEGVFQFMNAMVPTALVGGAMKLLKDNVKYKDSKPVKVAVIATSLIAGMPLAAFISNLINDPKDKEPDRKLTLKDSIVNMDDALSALVIAKVPVFGLDKLLPAIFAWCGYRAGQSN